MVMNKYIAMSMFLISSALSFGEQVVIFKTSHKSGNEIKHWVSSDTAQKLSFHRNELLDRGGVEHIRLSIEEAIKKAKEELALRYEYKEISISKIELKSKMLSKINKQFVWYYEINTNVEDVYILMDGTCSKMTVRKN